MLFFNFLFCFVLNSSRFLFLSIINTTFLNSSEVNQLPFRRIQSAHSQVTLTYQNLKVNKGSRSNIHAWVRARALSPDVFPKHLRATSAKSYLWISLEQLSGSENPQLQMYNFQKCARLQAMDQTQSTSLIASDLFSVYSGVDHFTSDKLNYIAGNFE
ncbi:uncharacterized protein LOC118478824 [Aplysia californica]|uniref:Uncharacterized protein LOC118478824 n=1 Tax=Aplysia californica TaxID=6500 RepID=A0ABM1W2Y2_APLCA|nr:uncharacterized protein LOC118478824 [Aplysia californica]